MPRLLSNRKPVLRPEDLKEDRWDYLNLQNAQPALGLAPTANEGYTLQTDEDGKVTWTNSLGGLEFENQTITGITPDEDIVITGVDNSSNIILSPFQRVQINGDAVVTGDFTVQGNPIGTYPVNPQTLYVTPNGSDLNDGTALDSSRACRTISGAVRSPFYTEGTTIKVAAGAYYEDNPIPLKPYTSVVGNDLRTTFVEPLNKDLDLFHVNSGIYIAQMQMRNLRRGSVERYAPGGAGTYTTGAYAVAFPPSLDNPIDVLFSPYIQNCTNQSGPWLKDGTMFVPNRTVQLPVAAGTSTWAAGESTITVVVYTGTIYAGMAVNDEANEGYRNAEMILQANKSFLQSQVVGFVNDTYPSLDYDQDKCYRDVGFIVEAIARDSRLGGNKRSIEAGLAYWSGETSLIDGEMNETANAVEYLKELSLHVIANSATTVTLYNTTTIQTINLDFDNGQVVTSRVINNADIIKSIIISGEAAVPDTVDDILGLIYPTGISPNNYQVASTVTNVSLIAENTYEITLSSPTVAPSDNAKLYFGYTTTYPYLDADVPTEWTSGVDDNYADRRLDPTGSGGGALVDGNAPSERSPIQSFVFDAFTQLNQGGNGIHIINNGYAQLVSVFTIFCSNAVIVENGGIASITNSNSNFGDTCMTAKGLGKLAYQGFVKNPGYPTNVPNGEYYPLGYWPQQQRMEVFLPNDLDRPHIGQVMEVVAPDTYINYEGVRVPYVNEAGYPGYLIATSNTGTITTGSYVISGIDVTNVAVGHTLYIRDVLGEETHPETGQPYATTGTQVVDVQYQTVVLDRPILNGYSNTNLNYFNLYFAGNAYYTVLSSEIDYSLASTVTNSATLVPGQETTTSLAVSYARDLALRVIQNVPITGYEYDKVKCARDTGIIVDTVVSDLMFSENGPFTQANFAGLQYWNQDSYVGDISNEITTTTNAIAYVKELAYNVVLGNTTSTPYQSTVTQNVSLPVATSVEAAAIRADFAVILDILTNGTVGVTDDIVANGYDPVSIEAQRAYDLLQANKSYLQAEAVAYVEDTKEEGFAYDQEKCLRDVGYMVDSVAHDILYGGNRQAIQSGVFYYGFDATSSAIENQQVQTTAAYVRLKDIIPNIITNVEIVPTVNNTLTQVTNLTSSTIAIVGTTNQIIDLITDIITDGPSASIEGLPIGQTRSTDVDKESAAAILLANKEFIKAEVTAYIDKYYGTGFVYDQAKCYRDTGLIVDALATDLLYPTDEKSQSNFAGLQYWNQAGYTGSIAGELTTTTNAIRYVRDLAAQVVQGINTGTRYQNTVTQNVASTFATSNESSIVYNDFDAIIDILVDGTAGVTDKIIPNGIQSTTSATIDAYTLLRNNKTYIQAEAIAYVEATKFTYDAAKCYRDTGLVIDAVALDLVYPNSYSQSTFAGLQYWNQDNFASEIPGELTTTTNAFIYLSDLMQEVVQTVTSGTRYQSTSTQNTDLDPATAVEAGLIADDFAIITNILTTGTTGVTDIIVPNNIEESTNTNIINAYNLIISNKEYLIDEVIAYVEDTKEAGFEYDQTLCRRDTGYVIDSVAFDLLHGGNKQAVQSGVYYYGYDDTSTAIPNQILQTLEAYNFIKNLSQRVVTNTTGSNYQSTVTQVTSLTPGTLYEVELIGRAVNTVTNIIQDGPDIVVTKAPITLDATTSTNALNAALILDANREFIQAETIAFINETQFFTYDQELCYRDVGYMVDSVAFDLIHPLTEDIPSNRQAIQSGVYYYGFSDTSSAIAGEIPQTTQAYNYIRSLIPYIVTGQVAPAYQDFITQTTSTSVASSNEINALYGNIDLIVNIINNGPTAANTKVPVSLTKDTDTNVFNAYQLLIANRQFIQEETIAYINENNKLGQYQAIKDQIFDYELIGGNRAIASLESKFDIISGIIKDGADSSPAVAKPRQYVDSDQGILNARRLLEKNRNFIQEEVVAYVDSIWPSKFSYDPVKCSRDTGLIVDSLAQDMLFNGNSQATFAGLQYWNQDNPLFPNELTTTTNAVRYLKDIAVQVIANNTSSYRYSSTVTQALSTVTANASTILALQSKFDVILDILVNGTTGITDRIVPNSLLQNTGTDIQVAFRSIQDNKEFIQTEVVEYVDQRNKFVYDETKCLRDTGLIVDAIVLDMQYPSLLDSQSTFAGLQYWNQDQYVGTIANEITTTTNAITYLSSIAQKVVVNNQEGTRYQSTVTQTTSTSSLATVNESIVIGTNFGVILNILNTGTVGVTDIIVPNGRPSISTATSDAYNLLLSNKEYMQAEVIAYIESTKEEGFEYDQTKCLRDVGYMIDSVAFDLLHGGNKQSVQSGVYYYGYNSTSTAINNEIPQTTAAYERIREIIPFIVQGIAITPSEGNTTNQITYMLPATVTQANTLQSKIDRITNIINNGPSVAPELTPISLTADANPLVDRAYDLMVANRDFIKAEVIAYVNQEFTGFEYDRDLCYRDVGYMLDSVSFDLLYSGNKQSIQSGVYYYGYDSTSTAIPKEIPQTTTAYNFIERIVSDIVTGTLITNLQQTAVVQTTSTNVASEFEVRTIQDNVNFINRIIEFGPDEVSVKEPIGLVETDDTDIRNAAFLLNANRDFIRAETIAFINNTYDTGFLYDKTKCQRDTGLIVDSIAFDLLYNGTTESTFAGLQYWNQDDYTGTVKAEITTTTNAIRYMKEIVGKVIVNTEVPVTAGNTATQVTNLTTGTDGIAKTVTDNVDIILSILANGTAGVTDIIVPNSKPSERVDITTSYDVLQANKEFIQSEVIARIDYDNTEFEYDRTTCARDIGYIVDSISFDLLHGGNRQSVTSGVYYYGFNAADTAIDDQIPQTTAAYERIKDIVGSIIKGEAVNQTYQYKVTQVLGTDVATDAETIELQDKIDNITNIINNGPDVAPVQQPISLVASTSTAVSNAFDLLIANRNFIKAEVTAYIDAKYTDTPNYDRNKCYRDVGAIIDAVGYDLAYGGNYNSVNTGNGYFNRKGQYHIVRLEQNVTDPTLFIDGATVRFYQQSYISASGYLFEYVGAGTQYGALPQVGKADPNQSKEVVQLNNGKVFFTSTDQNGDFRIGPTLVISQSTGILSGRTFQKSLYAEMTPFILVVGA